MTKKIQIGKGGEIVLKNKGIFSGKSRNNVLEQMSGETLDVLVIGGGITGCGIALDASQRGLNVGLVEMQDFAAGTSSRSTKLIHGGLRYLKQLEIQLVREVGQERAIVYKNAPHVVIPEPMLLPLVEGGTYGKLATSIGLAVYDRLAGVQKEERRQMLTKEETLKREPLLKEQGLKGGGLYVEYRTDDARLTIEVIKTAVQLGAKAVNYSKVTELLYNNGKVVGAVVQDVISGKSYTIRAKKVVNATGPWVDGIRKKDGSLKGKRLHLTKGVHIVIDQRRFPLQQAIYFDCPDGRMIFAIPRDGKTYIGTTDTNYEGDLIEPKMTQDDLTYLIDSTNDMFPSLQLTEGDVESHWVGLRPLIHEDGKSPSELSRKDEIFRSETGLITIAGGKLTGYRKMAEKIVNLVVKELSLEGKSNFPSCRTDVQVLSGGNVGGPQKWRQFFNDKVLLATHKGIEEDYAKRLVQRYGSNIDQVLKLVDAVQYDAQTYKIEPIILAELVYGVEDEMVVHAKDFLVRRTSDAIFDASRYRQLYEAVDQILKDIYSEQTQNRTASMS